MVAPALLASLMAAAPIKYPVTKTVNQVDIYHGVSVSDPYRWLEQPVTVPEVKNWVTAQNKVTFGYLDSIPGRDRLFKELNRRINFDRYDVPTERGGRVFYHHNSGLQNQDVLYVIDKAGAKPRVLLDPNTLSKDGTVAVGGMDVSLDGETLLYGINVSGSDWIEWHVKDVATGKDKPDVVKWSKFGGGVLNADASGIFYLSYPAPPGGNLFVASNENPKIMFHAMGTPQASDKVAFALEGKPDWFVYPVLVGDRKHLIVQVEAPGSTNNMVYILDPANPAAGVNKLFAEDDANYTVVDIIGDAVYYITTKDAPTSKIMVRYLDRDMAPKVIVPESKDTLEQASIVGGKLIVTYMQDAKSAVRTFKLDGTPAGEVKLPGIGSADGFSGLNSDKVTYFSFAAFTDPATIYKYDVDANTATQYQRPKLPFDTSKYVARQVFVKSKDGTKVPMSIVHKKGLKLDGKNPTLLYGYGGFNISNKPWFSTSRTVWMDMGGVWCLANIRGGGEYGKAWHESAIKGRRQNAYDDFIACGEWLVANKYASKKTLAIQGGSNGGLLIGVCMNQRPDLFGACIPEVGVMDMLRFNQFTIGKAWEGDYGSPQDAEGFFNLLRISPYHNLRPNTNYPATLVTTADTDDRVVPAHSFKYAAMLQACQAGSAPTLIRVETAAGHGGGKPITKQMEEIRDVYAFILHNVGAKIPAKF